MIDDIFTAFIRTWGLTLLILAGLSVYASYVCAQEYRGKWYAAHFPLYLFPSHHHTERGRYWSRRFWQVSPAWVVGTAATLVLGFLTAERSPGPVPDQETLWRELEQSEPVRFNWELIQNSGLPSVIATLAVAFAIIGLITALRAIYQRIVRR